MLKGKLTTLRPVRATDLERIYAYLIDIANRGDFYPRGILSYPAILKDFQETGFWEEHLGLLAIVNEADEVIGRVEYFRTVAYMDEYEIDYILYEPAERGKGITTEAVEMLVRYLFETKKINRIRLVIHPENRASRRLAEKCGFRHEGTARGAWYNQGKYHDMEVYSILHGDVIG